VRGITGGYIQQSKCPIIERERERERIYIYIYIYILFLYIIFNYKKLIKISPLSLSLYYLPKIPHPKKKKKGL